MPTYGQNLFVIILACFFIYGASIDTIRANESLRDSEALFSKGNKFKLSFFSPPNSTHRYVGIMFNLPVMTVVWVANRNKPLYDSLGTLQVSSNGNILIFDGQMNILWSTNLSISVRNSSAVLLDSGNLILQDHDSSNVYWESFLHASDSWLAKMKLFTDLTRNEKSILTSWRSGDDPAPGSFTFTIEPSDIPQFFILKDDDPYCRTGFAIKGGYDYGTFVGEDSQGTASRTFTLSNSSVVQYNALNPSGEVEEKVWSHEKIGWEVKMSSVDNECDFYGKCGPFGSCNAEERPICSCFQGFMPKSKQEWETGNWSSGCTRKTSLKCGEEDEFVKMESVTLPDHFKLNPLHGEECTLACKSNCSCIAYAYSFGIGCLHWTGELTDVKRAAYGQDLYIRVAKSSKMGNNQDNLRAFIVSTVIVGIILIAICAYFLPKLLLHYRVRKHTTRLQFSNNKATAIESSKQNEMHGVNLEELPVFEFQMLSDATNNFDPVNKLGKGGFGIVYKGTSPYGEEIAVKRLARSSNQGVEEFMNEVKVISRLQHRNLVRLIGCCVEYDEKMLVYEYMPNGSLDAYLFNSHKQQPVDWKTCKLIVEGICRGLLYLHRDSRLKIIHRDIKASNILLDEELNPKISDFGMASIFCGKDSQANTTRVVGTYGYMSPEYALHGIFSEKSDVYSFGVLLLEILCGRKNSSFYDEDQQLFLLPYAWKLWNEGNIKKLMDPCIGIYESGMEGDAVRYANVGLWCVQEIAADRPYISTVLSMLSCEIVELPRPKKPAFLGMHMSQDTQCSEKKCSMNDVTISVAEGR